MRVGTEARNSKKYYAFNRPINSYFKYGQDLHLVWKNLKSQFIGCSDMVESETGLSASAITGLTDADLIWSDRAQQYLEGEESVINLGKTQCFFEMAKMLPGEVSLLTFKTPLVNSAGHIDGIFGISFISDPAHMKDIAPLINELGILMPDPLFFLSADRYGVQLTPKEKECLQYLVKGKTASEIAKKLYRSRRTVEDYIESIKVKFDCHKKSELIEKILSDSLFNV